MKEVVDNRVSELRRETGVRQEDLAEAVGVTRQTIIALERGNYKPSVYLALKLAEYFDKSVHDIFYIKKA
jgi:putative transcriptional regulator